MSAVTDAQREWLHELMGDAQREGESAGSWSTPYRPRPFDTLIVEHVAARGPFPVAGHTTTAAVNAALRDFPDADVSALWVPATEALEYQQAWKRDLEKGRAALDAERAAHAKTRSAYDEMARTAADLAEMGRKLARQR